MSETAVVLDPVHAVPVNFPSLSKAEEAISIIRQLPDDQRLGVWAERSLVKSPGDNRDHVRVMFWGSLYGSDSHTPHDHIRTVLRRHLGLSVDELKSSVLTP